MADEQQPPHSVQQSWTREQLLTLNRRLLIAGLAQALLQPCKCGCGKLVDGGLMELAHPEDYRFI